MFALTAHHHHHHHHRRQNLASPTAVVFVKRQQQAQYHWIKMQQSATEWKRLVVHRLSKSAVLITQRKTVVLATAAAAAASCVFMAFSPPVSKSLHRSSLVRSIPWLRIEQEKKDAISTDSTTEKDEDQVSKQEEEEESASKSPTSPVSSGMIGALGFYKAVISPLLPPACRFLPTCSQYGVQAIEEFGPTKGSILIAWRILRCSPFGGKGIDYPAWPPVPYHYGSWT